MSRVITYRAVVGPPSNSVQPSQARTATNRGRRQHFRYSIKVLAQLFLFLSSNKKVSLESGLGKREKEAWYLLFAHARSIPKILGDRDTLVNLPAYLLRVFYRDMSMKLLMSVQTYQAALVFPPVSLALALGVGE